MASEDRVGATLRSMLSAEKAGGLSQDELAAVVAELHDEMGLRLGEIAMCLPRDRGQVEDLYNRGQEVLTDGI